MDHEVLVDAQIEDGAALITKLVSDGFDVTVAFWAKISDGGLWYFYIATKSLDSMSLAEAWRITYAALQQVRPCSISISQIMLIPSTDPAAIEANQHISPALAARYLKHSLGNLAIDDAYIYPKPKGTMTRGTVVATAASLMTRTGTQTPSLVILHDGIRMYAVPIGMRLTNTGGVDVDWHDVDADVDRTISADAVADIQVGRRTPTLHKVVR